MDKMIINKYMRHCRIYLVMLICIVCNLNRALADGEDVLYAKSCNFERGETKVVSFYLDNAQTYYGFQANLKLPEGLVFTSTNGVVNVTLSSRFDSSYKLVCNLVSPTELRVGAVSLSHNPIEGNSGALFSAELKRGDNYEGGTLSITDILFVNKDDMDETLPDCFVEFGTEHSNLCYIPDFEITENETKMIGIVLDNETKFSAFQLDLRLPEGLTIVDDCIELTSRATENHMLSSRSYSDGSVRIVCMASDNSNIIGSEGDLIEFEVMADHALDAVSQISITNQYFSTASGSEFLLPDASTDVTCIKESSLESLTIGDSTDESGCADGEGSAYVYGMDGSVVAKVADTKDAAVAVAPGMYVVKCADKTTKLLVK